MFSAFLDTTCQGLPHARGGVSSKLPTQAAICSSSPRPWGCFLLMHGCGVTPLVFPTPVGVFPNQHGLSVSLCSLPHARGGVSRGIARRAMKCASSPRPWGCFLGRLEHLVGVRVFPTPVGVFLCRQRMPAHGCSLPHARGGVSYAQGLCQGPIESSPRPWGCFSGPCVWGRLRLVFPTPVGVFLRVRPSHSPEPRLPHARGGVSARRRGAVCLTQSSPRPWGCFYPDHQLH